jgi:hypothetical protein
VRTLRQVAVAILASTGCTIVTSLDGLSADPPPDAAAPDVRAADAEPVEEDAGAPVQDSGLRTLFYTDFEEALDCDGWVGGYASTEPAMPGNTGARSCRVCGSVPGTQGWVDRVVAVAPSSPGSFRFTASIRSWNGATEWICALSLGTADGGTEGTNGGGTLSLAFERMQIVYGTANVTTQATVRLYAPTAGQCLLIDSARLEFMPAAR